MTCCRYIFQEKKKKGRKKTRDSSDVCSGGEIWEDPPVRGEKGGREEGEVTGKAGRGAGACVNGVSRGGGGALGRFRLGAGTAGDLSHRKVQISITGGGPIFLKPFFSALRTLGNQPDSP